MTDEMRGSDAYIELPIMRAALPHLTGLHDFAALRNVGTDVESTERTVLQTELHAMPPCEFYPPHAPMAETS